MAAFKNLDDQIIVIMMNENDQDQEISLKIKGSYINTLLDAHSIITLVL